MNKAISFIAIVFYATFTATAHYKVVPNMTFSTLNTNPGYITINEIIGGFGLGGTTTPYSKHFFGFTSINGYQVNKNSFLEQVLGYIFTIVVCWFLFSLTLDFPSISILLHHIFLATEVYC